MRVHPTIAPVVGATSQTHWAQTLQLPEAYGVVEVETPEGIARQRGVAILSRMSELLSTAPVSLVRVEEIADEVMTQDITSLILLVPVGSVCYVVMRGSGHVYLRRGDQFAVLLSGTGALSGEVKDKDTIILATHACSKAVTVQEMMSVFDHLPPGEVAEKLTLLLHKKNAVEGASALIFQVSELLPVENEHVSHYTAVAGPPAHIRYKFGRARRAFINDPKGTVKKIVKHVGSAIRISNIRRFPFSSYRVVLAVVLTILFIASVMVGVVRQTGSANKENIESILSEAQHAYEEGVALMELNPLKGRERLTYAKELLSPLTQSLSPTSIEERSVTKLYDQVAQSLESALQVHSIVPQVFFDSGLLRSGSSISALSYTSGLLTLLDGSKGILFRVTSQDGAGEVIGGGDSYQGGSFVATTGAAPYVLTRDGVYALTTHANQSTQVITANPSWGKIVALGGYGGNIYLLDAGTSRIWKYVATESGFSDIREYLNPDTLPDLSAATSLAIDGSVWVGTAGGEILKFTQGKQETFIIRGVEPALGQRLQVFTADDQKYLYIMDSDNARVVVCDKDGNYLAQYVWEKTFRPTAYAVSEESGKLFLLAEGKLFSIDLK